MNAERNPGSKLGVGHSGVYLAPADTSALHDAIAPGSLAWLEVDSREARNKDQFLAACARDLRFPRWFGANWDALADCLQDLSWWPARDRVVLWRGAGHFAASAPDEFATALEIFRDAATYWRQRGHVFVTLLDEQPPNAALVPFSAS